MKNYIDGFVLPLPKKCLSEYTRLAEKIAKIWLEHGALEYREFIGDDLMLEGVRAFPELLEANDNEVVIFGWVVFASREARDLANNRVSADPRMEELVNSSGSGFDASRMAYAGFQPLLKAQKSVSE